MPNTFKFSFSAYGFQVIEAYLNLVRHFFGFQILFPWWLWIVGVNHMSLVKWFGLLGWMPFGMVIRDIKLY